MAESKDKIKSRLFFPAEEALQFLATGMYRSASIQAAAGVKPEDIHAVDIADDTVEVSVAMYPSLVQALNEMETEALEAGHALDCARCHEEAEGALKQCPGIKAPGDLVKNIVGTALRVGMVTLLNTALEELEMQKREVSAGEIFRPVLSSITRH